MNQESRLPEYIRNAARRRSGTQEWSTNMHNGLVQAAKERPDRAKILTEIQGALDAAPTFTDLTDAVKEAYRRCDRGEWCFVMAAWEDPPKEYLVVPLDGKVMSFCGLRVVVDDTNVREALEALTGGTDTIEEV